MHTRYNLHISHTFYISFSLTHFLSLSLGLMLNWTLILSHTDTGTRCLLFCHIQKICNILYDHFIPISIFKSKMQRITLQLTWTYVTDFSFSALQNLEASATRLAWSVSRRLQRAAEFPLPHSTRDLRSPDNARIGTWHEGRALT